MSSKNLAEWEDQYKKAKEEYENKSRIYSELVDGYYVKSSTSGFSLRKVLNAPFQVKAFELIKMNNYRVYASLVCFEKIES